MIPHRYRRGPALAALAAGLVLAGVGGASLEYSGLGVGLGDVGYLPAALAADQPALGDTDTDSVDGAASPTEPRRESQDGSPPVRLELPSLGASAAVIGVEVDPEGSLDVPADPDVLGWWRSGASPGQARGSILIAGHVDTVTDGLGIFARLGDLEPGAPVLVATDTGQQLLYQLTERRQFPKAELPANLASSQDGPERLVLITCGGRFDRAAGGYSDNVLAFAVPDGDAARPARTGGG